MTALRSEEKPILVAFKMLMRPTLGSLSASQISFWNGHSLIGPGTACDPGKHTLASTHSDSASLRGGLKACSAARRASASVGMIGTP